MPRLNLPLRITVGDKYRPALSLRTQPEAQAYFKACVEHAIRFAAMDGEPLSIEAAEYQERANLLYFAGYYSELEQQRVKNLFRFKDLVAPVLPETRVKRMGF